VALLGGSLQIVALMVLGGLVAAVVKSSVSQVSQIWGGGGRQEQCQAMPALLHPCALACWLGSEAL